MNERIKERWLQAAREDSGDTWDSQTEFIERFAVLIIKECADISDASFHNGSAGYTAILKNFGVE